MSKPHSECPAWVCKNDLVALAMELGLDDKDAKDLAQGLGETKPSAQSQASSSKPLSISKEKGRHSHQPSKDAEPTKSKKSGAEVAEVANKAEDTPAS